MKKRNSEINGVKIINRYTVATFFSGFLSLISSVCFLLAIFLPVVSFTKGSLAAEARGKDFLLFLFNDSSSVLFSISAPILNMGSIGFNTFYCFGPLLIIGLVFSFVLLVIGLKLILVGHLYRYRRPAVWSFLVFFFFLLFALGLVGVGFIYKVNDAVGITMEVSALTIILVVISFLSFVILSIIFGTAFKGRVYIGNVANPLPSETVARQSPYVSDGIIKPVIKVKEVTKVKYEPASTLPTSLSSIGGHAFSQNTSLVVAMIPRGIDSLGPGAFANCPKLKIVSIPTTVKQIGYNCFFNCYSLERINYGGTKEQWRHIIRGSNWLAKAKTTVVVCSDGPIIVNPYH